MPPATTVLSISHMLSLFKPSLYIQISPERVTVVNVKSGASISEVPELAITTNGGKRVILAVGSQARLAAASASQSATWINPFGHPRTLVGDFTTGQQVLKMLVRQVLGSSSLPSLAPTVVIHPLGSPAGGFTEVETRAFREMALGTGASQVFVWTGRVLTNDEVASRAFPLTEGALRE